MPVEIQKPRLPQRPDRRRQEQGRVQAERAGDPYGRPGYITLSAPFRTVSRMVSRVPRAFRARSARGFARLRAASRGFAISHEFRKFRAVCFAFA